jgi:hypothetical protein
LQKAEEEETLNSEMVQMKQNHEAELKTKQNQLYTANKAQLKNITAVKTSYETQNHDLRKEK